MKVCVVIFMIDTLTNIIFTRCTYLLFTVWSPQMLSNAFLHFWTSVTLHNVLTLTATPLMPLIMPTMLPHLLQIFLVIRCAREWFRAAMSALPGPLSHQYPRFWCSQWALLIHHRILPHHCCQKTMETLKPLWSIGSNANHKPTTGQAGHCMSWFHCMWDAPTWSRPPSWSYHQRRWWWRSNRWWEGNGWRPAGTDKRYVDYNHPSSFHMLTCLLRMQVSIECPWTSTVHQDT